MSSKVHELLAVNDNLKAQADKTRAELMSTFEKKSHHFSEKRQVYKPYEEGRPEVVESQLDLQTTVPKELKWIAPFLIKSLDVAYQVAEANTQARSDVVLEDGTIILTSVPATYLLELEKRCNELHQFVGAIPTLDPAKGFRHDSEKGIGVFRARDEVKKRTFKSTEPLVLYPATEKHPAQVQVIQKDVPTGDILTMEWSGLITTADKGRMLERVEDLTRAVKKARSKANDTSIDVTKLQKLGSSVIDFVFGL